MEHAVIDGLKIGPVVESRLVGSLVGAAVDGEGVLVVAIGDDLVESAVVA